MIETATVNTIAHRSFLARALAAVLLVAAIPVAAQERAGSGGAVDLVNQLTELRGELRELRADIERLQQQTQQAQAIARSQYLDLDDRLEQLEQAAAPTAQARAGSDAAAPVPAQNPDQAAASDDSSDATDGDAIAGVDEAATDAAGPAESEAADAADAAELADAAGEDAGDPVQERDAYDLAFAALRAGDYAQSAQLFQDFLRAFPNGDYAPNARYWLGESHYVVGDYAGAEQQFKALIARWPNHDKTPGALLKVGLSQFGQKQYDAAEATLGEVQRRWPGSDPAKTAADRLRAIQLSRLN